MWLLRSHIPVPVPVPTIPGFPASQSHVRIIKTVVHIGMAQLTLRKVLMTRIAYQVVWACSGEAINSAGTGDPRIRGPGIHGDPRLKGITIRSLASRPYRPLVLGVVWTLSASEDSSV